MKRPTAAPERPALSPVERRVALGLAECLTVREISDRLSVNFETVRAVIKRLRDKTGRRRKAALALWAAANARWLKETT